MRKYNSLITDGKLWRSKKKSTAKIKTEITLRITKKNFQDKELPHELFLTARQKIK